MNQSSFLYNLSLFFLGLHHVARFDFSPQDYRELALHQGEIVNIVCFDNGGWVKVINSSGEQGWVPRNFIAEIDPEDYVNTKKAVEVRVYIMKLYDLTKIWAKKVFKHQ